MLSSIVLASLNSARSKARDAQRKSAFSEMAKANEFYYDTNKVYVGTAGWLTNWNPSSNALAPLYIPTLMKDPGSTNYMYLRKDYRGYGCMTTGTSKQYGFYAKLENPSTSDLATILDSFDTCVKTLWGMNYKVGN